MMSTTLTFDTLQYAKRLKDADVPDKQAEAQAQALRDVLSERDGQFSNLQTRVQTVSDNVERDAKQAATTTDVLRLDTKIDLVRKDMEALENRIVIRLTKSMVAVMGLGLAASAAIVRLLA